jgi:hypothetical protein
LKKRISRKTHGCVFRAVAQGREARPTPPHNLSARHKKKRAAYNATRIKNAG